MNRDPWSGEQLRFARRLPNSSPISGPWTGEPRASAADLWVGVVVAIVALLLITSDWTGWLAP